MKIILDAREEDARTALRVYLDERERHSANLLAMPDAQDLETTRQELERLDRAHVNEPHGLCVLVAE